MKIIICVSSRRRKKQGPPEESSPEGPPEGGGWGVEPPTPNLLTIDGCGLHLRLSKRPAFGPAHFIRVWGMGLRVEG